MLYPPLLVTQPAEFWNPTGNATHAVDEDDTPTLHEVDLIAKQISRSTG
ncbi:hypothetical protein [Streptomyces coffeae]|nr:hypothetical protein [Streptomyces coffeae]